MASIRFSTSTQTICAVSCAGCCAAATTVSTALVQSILTCVHAVQSQRVEDLQDLLNRVQHELAHMPVAGNDTQGILRLDAQVRQFVMMYQEVTTEMAALVGATARLKVCSLSLVKSWHFPASARATSAKICDSTTPWHDARVCA